MTLAHSGCLSIKTHSVQCRCLSIMSVGTNKGISTIKMLTVWKVGLGEMMQKLKNLYWNQLSNELAFVRAIEPLSIKPLQITKFSRWLSMSSLRHWYLKVSENSHNKHLWIISFCFTQDTRYKIQKLWLKLLIFMKCWLRNVPKTLIWYLPMFLYYFKLLFSSWLI